eukprot:gene30554-39816_t
MTEERDKESAKNSSKPNSEAIIRLSQLASEITHKSEMQTALIHAQQQLSEVQQQWTTDVESLKDALTLEAMKLTDSEN